MALLAGLPQAPSDYDPIQNMEGAKARRALGFDPRPLEAGLRETLAHEKQLLGTASGSA